MWKGHSIKHLQDVVLIGRLIDFLDSHYQNNQIYIATKIILEYGLGLIHAHMPLQNNSKHYKIYRLIRPAVEEGGGRMLKLDQNSSNNAEGSPLVKISAYWKREGTWLAATVGLALVAAAGTGPPAVRPDRK
ncbi:hypothetical protein Tco_1056201 [Tanacetum coccineum]|uniref:Uncharacterized protein n=1 Tax=Tanacetum coccineum TaxID=301880 RepID=A0ABQ5H2S3_9ASTR